MLLMIDNYDSFTYNLAQYFAELGASPLVLRNNISIEEINFSKLDAVIISPGPCSPKEAGVSCELIKKCAKEKIPLLGVCLGHQCIAEVFGGKIIHAPYLMHGKISQIIHDGKGVFSGIPSNFNATRYHSLIVEKKSLPKSLIISAKTEDGIIMAIRHDSLPIEGVQFHPESILTEHGKKLLFNFLLSAGIKTKKNIEKLFDISALDVILTK